MRNALIRLLPLIALLLATVGCAAAGRKGDTVRTGPAGGSVKPQLVEFVRAPKGWKLDKPVWLPKARKLVVVVTPAPTTLSTRTRLAVVSLPTRTVTPLSLCPRHTCSSFSFDFPTSLPNGALGYERTQFGETPRIGDTGTVLMEYNFATHAQGKIVPYGLPQGVRSFTFRRGMTDGIINDGDGLYERLLSLMRTRAVPMSLPFTRAGYPAWSPDGTHLAVDAAPSTEHAKGLARVNLPRTLYLRQAPNGNLRPLVSNLSDVGISGWSPDSRWLAARLVPRHGTAGLYLINARSGKLFLVRKGNDAGSAAWITRHLLAVSVGLADPSPASSTGLVLLRIPRLPHD